MSGARPDGRLRRVVVGGLLAVFAGVGAASVASAQQTPPATGEIANPTVAAGGVLEVSGTGWTHPTDGGSSIAVKFDFGQVKVPVEDQFFDDEVFQIIEVDATGTFAVQVNVPDFIGDGSHTLNLLSGRLKQGDTARSVALAFTVDSAPATTTTTPAPTTTVDPGPSTTVDPGITTTTLPPPGGSGVDVNVIAEVPETGGLTISVAAESTTMSEPTADGDALVSTGSLPAVSVIDLRSGDPGWNATGQVTDFTSGASTISADQLGWAPNVASASAGQDVTAGEVAEPGAGLGTARALASTPAGAGRGTAVLGADLTLSIPTDVDPGTYTAQLTLTVI
ncbi:MAG: hypothetical protein ACK5OX_19215 [Desertimonas sp.]